MVDLLTYFKLPKIRVVEHVKTKHFYTLSMHHRVTTSRKAVCSWKGSNITIDQRKCIFLITCLTRLVNLRKTVQHFKQLEMFDITAQVLVQNSTGHKKQSLKGYTAIFLAYLVTSTYDRIELIKPDAEGGFR